MSVINHHEQTFVWRNKHRDPLNSPWEMQFFIQPTDNIFMNYNQINRFLWPCRLFFILRRLHPVRTRTVWWSCRRVWLPESWWRSREQISPCRRQSCGCSLLFVNTDPVWPSCCCLLQATQTHSCSFEITGKKKEMKENCNSFDVYTGQRQMQTLLTKKTHDRIYLNHSSGSTWREGDTRCVCYTSDPYSLGGKYELRLNLLLTR